MKVILTERFKKDLRSKVSSRKIYTEIRSKVEHLTTIPTMGSTDVPKSITKVYGNDVRKLPNPPFLIIYEYSEKKNLIIVEALIHERQAY